MIALSHLLQSGVDAFAATQQWLFETAVQPLMFRFELGNLLEDGYLATGWLLVGLIQLALMLAVMGPLQRLWPAQTVSDPAEVRTDILYTLIHRLGLFRVALFFTVEPLWDSLLGELTLHGWTGIQLDAVVAPWWPGVSDTALASFLVYLLAFDLLDYWLHRGEHRFDWWWALHAVHHSQRDMTMWSDNRNHLLADVLHDAAVVLVGHALGVAPGQFVAIVACTQLIESLSHANTTLRFGGLGERLLVSPRYHRIHHGLSGGAEASGEGTIGGHNFSILFPVWDVIFGTAKFAPAGAPIEPTGIRDQWPTDGRPGRDYGRGFWAQQWRGLARMVGRA